MVKKAVAVSTVVVLSLVTACGASPTPTRTPEATATPVELRATKPEHLAGVWLLAAIHIPSPTFGGAYYRWDPDGTVWWAEDAEIATNLMSARFWFEDGLYYEEESPICDGIGVYEVHLGIQGGRAVRLRMTRINDGSPVDDCRRAERYGWYFFRVD
jgi:hypothetical protein